LKRILICAPSNAAVDELVLRLKNGVIGHGGNLIKPGIVRLGRSDVINASVRELTLEELVDQKLNALDDNTTKELMGALRKEQNQNLAERDKLRQQQSVTEDPAKREAFRLEILALTKVIKSTGHKLDLQREYSQVRARKRDIERRKAQAQIIKQSQVICATLSGSAHSVLSSLKMRFDTVIIDEAAQCIELSALIPLKYGCKQCIMVGDPNQLPPTVLSQQAASLKYEQSLFVRMFNKHQDRVHMLNVQFRMHPDIAEFPSKEFYNGKLETGNTNLERTKKSWHDDFLFSPYRFFNVKGSHERSERTKSLFNKKEAMVAFQLYRALENKIGHSEIAGKVGIISPYKQQVNLLKRVFRTELGELGAADIDFNTIDGFQGQEKEVIIISCVRAEPDGHGVGFLGDTRRMNVAVTRAKSALWILGNEESLLKNPVWRRLVADAKKRHLYTDCKPGYLNNLFRNGGQAAHKEKRKYEDDDQSGRKKKKSKSRDDRRVDNMQGIESKRNLDDKKNRDRHDRRDNRPERDTRSIDDDDNYEPSLPIGPRQYKVSNIATAIPVHSSYNSHKPSIGTSVAVSSSVPSSVQPVAFQTNGLIREEDGYEPRPASQKPATSAVTRKHDDDDDYEPRPVSRRTVPIEVDDDDSYEPQLSSAPLPTPVASAGGNDEYEPRPPTQRPVVAARNINKLVPPVRRPPPPNQQVRGTVLPLPTMPLPGRPVGPTGVMPPVGPASLMPPSGPANSSLPTRPASMVSTPHSILSRFFFLFFFFSLTRIFHQKTSNNNMNKFPFNKYQGTAAKKKNRNKKPANVLLPSKRPGQATSNNKHGANINSNINNSNSNSNNNNTTTNNNNNNGPGNNSNRPNNKKNSRQGKNNKPKNKRPGPGPGPGPGTVPSIPSNLDSINSNGRPIPKPY
jgi:predicted DNA helicase